MARTSPDYLDVRDIAPNDELTIHLKPFDSSEIVGKIPHKATCLKNLGYTDDSNWWCKIVYQGTMSWGQWPVSKRGWRLLPEYSRKVDDQDRLFIMQMMDQKLDSLCRQLLQHHG
jgi:hypothetical protein